MSNRPRIAIIGGGFSGAVVALHLLRESGKHSFDLDVIEPRPVIGGGLAYSTDESAHRINVAAARMTPLPDDPEHFDRWFRQSNEAGIDPTAIIADGRAYPRRSVFGRYVNALVRTAAKQAAQARFRHLQTRAVEVLPGRAGYRLVLDNGETTTADLIVLATGHTTPGIPAAFRPVASHARFVANPWATGALDPVRSQDWVLIIGTGLTMADTVASLRARGHEGQITAISRRGLLSQARTNQPVEAFGDFQTAPAKTLSALLRRVRSTAAELRQAGKPWENVIDAIRQQGRVIWDNLPLIERQRFQRHLRPYWDSHRYQVAPQIHDVIRLGLQQKSLQVLAASFRDVQADDDIFQVRIHRRGSPAKALVERHFHAVINCTGPDHKSAVSGNPVLASLERTGHLTADPLQLGIHVDHLSRVIGTDGQGQATLLAAGPPARFSFGELMGLPQVTLQAKSVADQVSGWLRHRAAESPLLAAPPLHAVSA